MSDQAQIHNAAVEAILVLMVQALPDEGDKWVVLESLCLGVGRLHGKSDSEVAETLDYMSSRLAAGERSQ